MAWQPISPGGHTRKELLGVRIGVQCGTRQSCAVFSFRPDVIEALNISKGDHVEFLVDGRKLLIRKTDGKSGYAVTKPTHGDFLRVSMTLRKWPNAVDRQQSTVTAEWKKQDVGIVVSVPDFLDARYDSDAVVTRSARRRMLEEDRLVAV